MDSLIVRTPLIRFDPVGGNIFLKPENLQPFASYKIRGVQSAIEAAKNKPEKLVAASAGNMAQAVAFMAQSMGIPAEIFVPESAPKIKKDAIRKLGAELVELPFDAIWSLVQKPPQKAGELFFHPVFTPGLLDGYGLIAHEMLIDLPSLDAIVVPFGVGGLTLGIARTLKRLKPEVKIYTCEPETAAPLHASLRAGHPVKVKREPSFVDAIGTPEVLAEVFNEAKDFVTDSLVVSLDEVKRAMSNLAIRKLICEGAAAASLAASLKLAHDFPKLKIGSILTGGNVPTEVLFSSMQ